MRKLLWIFVLVSCISLSAEVNPWICKQNGRSVYKINVFNLSTNVSQDTLEAILNANKKDINKSFTQKWGRGVDIKLYPADQATNPKRFKGDRIPFFIVDSSILGYLAFHANQPTDTANTGSFLWVGNTIADTLGLQVPNNFPHFTPYAAADFSLIQNNANLNITRDNTYGLTDPEQLLSFMINHQLKELLTNDSSQNWTVFDTFAPTVANWHYAEFDVDGVVTNGTPGVDGYVHLPFFLDTFQEGGILSVYQENGDVVSRPSATKLQSYVVDGWSMTNYATSNFWKGYYLDDKIKWDKKGYVENPLQPYGGHHQLLLFLNFDTGFTSYGSVENYGPITPSQRGDPVENNFPPDYTYVRFYSSFTPTLTAEGCVTRKHP